MPRQEKKIWAEDLPLVATGYSGLLRNFLHDEVTEVPDYGRSAKGKADEWMFLNVEQG